MIDVYVFSIKRLDEAAISTTATFDPILQLLVGLKKIYRWHGIDSETINASYAIYWYFCLGVELLKSS